MRNSVGNVTCQSSGITDAVPRAGPLDSLNTGLVVDGQNLHVYFGTESFQKFEAGRAVRMTLRYFKRGCYFSFPLHPNQNLDICNNGRGNTVQLFVVYERNESLFRIPGTFPGA